VDEVVEWLLDELDDELDDELVVVAETLVGEEVEELLVAETGPVPAVAR